MVDKLCVKIAKMSAIPNDLLTQIISREPNILNFN